MIQGTQAKHYESDKGEYLGQFAGYIDEDGQEHPPAIPKGARECSAPVVTIP